MENLALNKDRLTDQETKQLEHTFEGAVLRRVIKDNWRRQLDHSKVDKQSISMLESHILYMNNMLGSYDYELLSVPNIIANSKNMSRGEFRAYLNYLEALTTGYKRNFTTDFICLVLAGLTLKAKSLGSLSKHYNTLLTELEGKRMYYTKRIAKENGKIDNATLRLRYYEASMLRFLRAKKIMALKKHIDARTKRVKKLQTKAQSYESVINNLKTKTHSQSPSSNKPEP